jgi:hypothetical protein
VVALLEISASALTEVGLISVVKSVDLDHLMQIPTNKFLSISTYATNGYGRKIPTWHVDVESLLPSLPRWIE